LIDNDINVGKNPILHCEILALSVYGFRFRGISKILKNIV